MKNKPCLIQTCLLAALLAMPAAVQAQFNYTTNNGTITITGYTGSGGHVTIPDTINGLPVTSIGDAAFYNCLSLTNLTIPGSVTSIGDAAFANCRYLTYVFFAGNAPSLGSGGLEFSILFLYGGGDPFWIPEDAVVYYLSGTAGWNDTFADLPTAMLDGPPQFGATVDGWNYVSDGVKNTLITGYAGSNSAVVIPSMINGIPVTGIGWEAFSEETGLVSVTIPDSVTTIGNFAFVECTSLTTVTIPDSVLSIGSKAFAATGLTNATLGSGITNLGGEAFANCYALANIFIAGNAPDAGQYTFGVDGGDGLPDVAERATVYYLSGMTGWSNTFAGLPTVRLDGPPHFGATADGWNYASDQIRVTIITGYGGSNSAVVIPSVINGMPVTGIGLDAFTTNGSLTSVTIPDSVMSIGESAFQDCVQLTNVVIGHGVTDIEDWAFEGCLKLRPLTIPASVTNLGNVAFGQCWSLDSIYFGGNAPAINSDLFYNDIPTVYYLPGTLGWTNTFAERPTALWFLPQPLILNQGPAFGVQSGQFGFTISWATNTPVVVEACSNLSNPIWIPVSTNNLINGTSHFSDPQSANLLGRYYRLRSP